MQNLTPHTTFGVMVNAEQIKPFDSTDALLDLLNDKTLPRPFLTVGGGSNFLFTKDWPGTILLNQIKSREKIEEDAESVWMRFGAGENWHEIVQYTLEKNLSGIENLALIPGTIGAAPIQNIGAYGVELADFCSSVEVINLSTLEVEFFSAEECDFGYRDSFFKAHKDQYIITHVTLELSKIPNAKTSYGGIQSHLDQKGIKNPTPQDVFDTVVEIRQSKLPDPEKEGSAGSFFKNPIVSPEVKNQILKTYPEAPHFKTETGFKIPAGWLIQTAGWKGTNRGTHGVNPLQALILINYGGATGSEIWQLAQEIQQSVKSKFNIELEPEVRVE